MKTDVYFNYAGENFSQAQFQAGLAGLKNTADGLVVWSAPLGRPVTDREEKAVARLEALRAALERFSALADQIDAGEPVEALDGKLERLTAILQGVAMGAAGLEKDGPLRLAGGPGAIPDLLAALDRLREETERLNPDSAGMAKEMMEHGRILTFEENAEAPAEPEDPAGDPQRKEK